MFSAKRLVWIGLLLLTPGAGWGEPCEIKIGVNDFPRDLNPFVDENHTEGIITSLVFSSLMEQASKKEDPAQAYQPLAATFVRPAETGRQNTFHIKLHSDIRLHRSTRKDPPLNVDDMQHTLSGIRGARFNAYQQNRLRILGVRDRSFDLLVEYPWVGKPSELFRYLTFPIVRDLKPDEPITTPGQEVELNGSGPFFLDSFTINELIFRRFDAYSVMQQEETPRKPILRVRLDLSDFISDIFQGLASGKYQAILGLTAKLLERKPDLMRTADPALNSFEYLGFNRSPNLARPATELFGKAEFRRLVWAASADEALWEILEEMGGVRLLSLQQPSASTVELRDWSGEKTTEEIREDIVLFFENQRRLKPKPGQRLSIVAKGFTFHGKQLADQIYRSLDAAFEGYLDFGPGPVIIGTRKQWRERVLEARDFDLVIDTFYYGSRPKVMNMGFLTSRDESSFTQRLNLTGASINPKKYERRENYKGASSGLGTTGRLVYYDRFLQDVNRDAEVVVLGKLPRFHVLNRSGFDVRRDRTAPFFHDIFIWSCISEKKRGKGQADASFSSD